MAKAGEVSTYREPPAHLLERLRAHLPYSLPLLRRLEYALTPGGTTEHARILLAAGAGGGGDHAGDDDGDDGAAFAAAYVDLSRSPETQIWVYSSLEWAVARGGSAAAAARGPVDGEQALALLREMRGIRDAHNDAAAGEGAEEEGRRERSGMIGSLATAVRALLASRGCAFPYHTSWDAWVFRADRLPRVDVQAEMERRGLRWGGATGKEDYPLIISRTKIPKQQYGCHFLSLVPYSMTPACAPPLPVSLEEYIYRGHQS